MSCGNGDLDVRLGLSPSSACFRNDRCGIRGTCVPPKGVRARSPLGSKRTVPVLFAGCPHMLSGVASTFFTPYSPTRGIVHPVSRSVVLVVSRWFCNGPENFLGLSL